LLSSGKDFNNLQYMCIHYELLANMLVALIIMCVAAMQPRYKAVADDQHAAFVVRRAKTHRHVLHLRYAMMWMHWKQNVPASRLRYGFAAAVGQRGLADVELGWSSQKRHSDSLPS